MSAPRPLPPLLLRGDCIARMRDLPDASIDAIVTDPPYGLEFMGKAWDRYTPLDFEQWCASWATEALRVLKPGGHLLAFGGSRTWHRLAAGIEDAGFEVRDSIAWLYGSGFPKSLDVSKAIDKAAGAERDKVVGSKLGRPGMAKDGSNQSFDSSGVYGAGGVLPSDILAPATPEAAAWQGWGTALKPAFEPIVVARKPLAGTVAANVLQYGTGALNIDASRIGHASADDLAVSLAKNPGREDSVTSGVYGAGRPQQGVNAAGRWPANVMLDEGQAAALDAQTGTLTSGVGRIGSGKGVAENASSYASTGRIASSYGDTGGASRFFYVAPLEDLEERFVYKAKAPKGERPRVNGVTHATVKPLALMRYLCTLVTPPGGVVLDPFAGSGTTLEAAHMEGFEAIGIELTPDYWPLIEARIERAVAARQEGADRVSR